MKVKTIALFSLLFSTLSYAKTKLSCTVVNLVDDNYFDTALTSIYTGDEDYASIEVSDKNNSLTIGGLRFRNDQDTKVEIVDNNDGIKATLTYKSNNQNDVIFHYSYTNGTAHLYSMEQGKKHSIAWANCFCTTDDYYEGTCSFDPYDTTPITFF